jgi:hypothetical protein
MEVPTVQSLTAFKTCHVCLTGGRSKRSPRAIQSVTRIIGDSIFRVIARKEIDGGSYNTVAQALNQKIEVPTAQSLWPSNKIVSAVILHENGPAHGHHLGAAREETPSLAFHLSKHASVLIMHGGDPPTWTPCWCRAPGEPLPHPPPHGHAHDAQREECLIRSTYG